MSLFNLPIIKKEKPTPPPHPWAKTIRDELSHMVKQSHNSVRNVRYPKLKEKVLPKNRVTFTVMGNRVTKEFIYCVHLVQSMYTYRSKKYAPPVIRAFTGVEWESIASNELKIKYGDLAHCLRSQVAVLRDNELIGGEKELKELLESMYYIHMLALDYCKESVKLFAKFIKDIGRPCAYLHISVNGKPIGSLMFMLYSDIVPQTCENFLRLCQSRKGGYSGTPVHRIVKDGWIQCGGFGLKSVKMDCENFIVQHDRRGVLAMANAGRNSDCSTQFFVLLQPNPCFKLRFVAFGQLIDGEETLKQIENLNTYYEAPVDNIVIYSAGVVNLDCQDIRINKGALEYIDKHIEDLVIIGDLFYAILLDRVFLEAEFRKIQRLEPGAEEEEAVDEAFRETVNERGEYIPENIRATRRFIRKKDAGSSQRDNQSQVDTLEKRRADRPGSGASTRRNVDDTINNDFDMESLPESYEPEHYSYRKVSVTSSIITKPPQPYYLALTDVRYPDEVDSTFDLKRFLQGNYCLEADLTENKSKVPESPKVSQRKEEKLKAVSAIITSYHGVKWHAESSSDTESYSENELDSDDEQEIKKFLEENTERVSFSGQIIKNISTKFVSANPLEDKLPHEFWNDEELRRMRLAVQDIRSRVHKKVSLAVEPWKHQTAIKRRMTGYVKPGDLPAPLRVGFEGDEEEEGADKSNDQLNRVPSAVDVSICAPEQHGSMIMRRQTGFNKTISPFIDIELEEEDEEKNKPAEDTRTRNKTGVKIAPREMNTQQLISPVASSKSVAIKKMSVGPEQTRPSVLMRLYDDIAIDSHDVPTLKDYKPVGEMKYMSLLSVFGKENPLLRRDVNPLKSSSTNVETLLFDRKRSITKKKHSIDSEKSVRYAERKSTNSYRTLEYSRKRPSISVAEYQQMNKQRMEQAELAEQRKSTRENRWN